jgi:hypothetical protein
MGSIFYNKNNDDFGIDHFRTEIPASFKLYLKTPNSFNPNIISTSLIPHPVNGGINSVYIWVFCH